MTEGQGKLEVLIATGLVTVGFARWRLWPYYAGDLSRFVRQSSPAAAAARH